MPKKKKKRNRSELQMWKERLDTVFSQYIRLRDSDQDGYCKCFTCEYVGFWKGDNIQNGHFRSRRYNSTRFHEINCHAQCATCNVYRHGEQYLYGKKVDEIYGEGTADDLVQLSLETRKFTAEELKELHDEYSQKRDQLIKEKGI